MESQHGVPQFPFARVRIRILSAAESLEYLSQMNSSTKCPEGASSPEIDAVVHSFPQQSSVSAGESGLKYGVLRSSRSRPDMKEYEESTTRRNQKIAGLTAEASKLGFVRSPTFAVMLRKCPSSG